MNVEHQTIGNLTTQHFLQALLEWLSSAYKLLQAPIGECNQKDSYMVEAGEGLTTTEVGGVELYHGEYTASVQHGNNARENKEEEDTLPLSVTSNISQGSHLMEMQWQVILTL